MPARATVRFVRGDVRRVDVIFDAGGSVAQWQFRAGIRRDVDDQEDPLLVDLDPVNDIDIVENGDTENPARVRLTFPRADILAISTGNFWWSFKRADTDEDSTIAEGPAMVRNTAVTASAA